MVTIRVLLALAMCLCGIAGEPNERARKDYKESTYKELVRIFGVPKAFWNPQHVADAPSRLRSSLDQAIRSRDGCRVLGVLDCIEDLDSLTSDEKRLKAQVAWSESFYKDGEKASRDTELAPLFKALDRERRGKKERGSLTSTQILRESDYRLLVDSVSWDDFRNALIKLEAEAVLSNENFVLNGSLPKGFDPRWMRGIRGNPAVWDRAWGKTWAFPEPMQIAGLLSRMSYFRPQGLDREQQTSLDARLETLWGLPYQWASSSAALTDGVLPEKFLAKVKAARQLSESPSEAARNLAKVASNPRDYYELSHIRGLIGTEQELKQVIDQEAQLMRDPGLSGWTQSAAKARIDAIHLRYQNQVAVRNEGEMRAAKEKMDAALAQLAEKARHEKEVREQQEVKMETAVHQGVIALGDIARGHFQNDRSMIEAGIRRLNSIATDFKESTTTMSLFRKRVLDGWASGRGRSIANDDGIPPTEKAQVNSLINNAINALGTSQNEPAPKG